MREGLRVFGYLASRWWSAVLVWVCVMVFVYGCTPGQNYFPDGGFWVYLLLLPVAGWLACALVALVVGLVHRGDAAPQEPDAARPGAHDSRPESAGPRV